VESMSTNSIVPRPSEPSGFVDRIVRPLTHRLNPLILRIAGGWWFPMFSLLHHRGHKSGRMYATPISAMPRGGFFWLAVTFGENAGWVRNIMAAREADLRYRGIDYHLVAAVMLDGAAVKSELPGIVRFGMPLLGVHKVIRMRAIAQA
jgi:deazaflavin-dependent oxidoreductase (nitroreductase family)